MSRAPTAAGPRAADVSLLHGRVAIVTGSTRGIGYGIAAAFVSEGARVVVTGRDKEDVDHAVRTLGALDGQVAGIAGDFRSRDWAGELVAFAHGHFGQLDVLVNNSGIAPPAALSAVDTTEVDEVLEVNLRASIDCARAAAPYLFVSPAASLINISSSFGIKGRRNYAVYSATKAGLDGLTRALAVEWAREGVRVNAIAPGYIATRINEQAFGHASIGPDLLREIPMHRVGQPSDVGAASVFLASDLASYITGHTLVVDGGLSIR